MLAAAAVLSGSVAAAARVPAGPVPVVPVPVPHEAELPVLVPVPLEPLLLHLRPLLLPRAAVASEVTLRLRGRQSWSAAMARRSPPTVP